MNDTLNKSNRKVEYEFRSRFVINVPIASNIVQNLKNRLDGGVFHVVPPALHLRGDVLHAAACQALRWTLKE